MKQFTSVMVSRLHFRPRFFIEASFLASLKYSHRMLLFYISHSVPVVYNMGIKVEYLLVKFHHGVVGIKRHRHN